VNEMDEGIAGTPPDLDDGVLAWFFLAGIFVVNVEDRVVAPTTKAICEKSFESGSRLRLNVFE